MTMRIYGLYQKNRSVLIFLLAIALCAITVGCVGVISQHITTFEVDKVTSRQSFSATLLHPPSRCQLCLYLKESWRVLCTVYILLLERETSCSVVHSVLIDTLRSLRM